MTDERKTSEASQKPRETLEDRLRLSDEECAAVDAMLADPDQVQREVAWRDAGPDPFGMNWDWLAGDQGAEPPSS